MKNALFFPYINIPPEKWILQMLLYLDEVGSIVPYDYVYQEDKMEPFMRDLVASKLVKNIVPVEYVKNVDRFTETFLQVVERKISRRRRHSDSKEYFRIHIEKMDYRLTEELRKMRLLEHSDYPWFLVEKKTAIYFMAFLASSICIDPKLEMVPFTNEKRFLKPFFSDQLTSSPPALSYEDDLSITISKILPVPETVISIQSLIRFKEKNNKLLSGFRDEIESKIELINLLDDKSTRKYQLQKFIQESQEKIDELKSKMEEQRWGRVNFGTIAGLGSAAIPVVEAIINDDPSELIKSLPGIAGAIYSMRHDYSKAKKEIKSSPYAYAAYEQKYKFRTQIISR